MTFSNIQDLNPEQIVIATIETLNCFTCGQTTGGTPDLQDASMEQIVIQMIERISCGGGCE